MMVMAAEDLDDGRGQRLLRDIAQVAALQALRGQPEALRFEILGAETFYYLMSGDGLLQDLVQTGGHVLRVPCGAANLAAQPHGQERDDREDQAGSPETASS